MASIQFANPDVPIADGITVILKNQRPLGCDTLELCCCGGSPMDGGLMLDEDAVVKHRKGTGFHRAICLGFGGDKNNVVGLPLSWRTRGIHQRSGVAVKGTRLAIEVGFVIERVENLDFVASLKIDTTVATTLSRACLLYTSPSPRDQRGSRMPSSA